MTSEGLGEMFDGDTADMCGKQFPLMLMGGRVEGLVCADPGVRTPIGVIGIIPFNYSSFVNPLFHFIPLTNDLFLFSRRALPLQVVPKKN